MELLQKVIQVFRRSSGPLCRIRAVAVQPRMHAYLFDREEVSESRPIALKTRHKAGPLLRGLFDRFTLFVV